MPKKNDFFDANIVLNSGSLIDKTDQQCKVITLESPAPLIRQTENFKKPDTGCSSKPKKKEYDIVYIPAQKKFWLVPQQIMDELNESSDELYNALTTVTPTTAQKSTEEIKAARMRALSKSGLIDFFISPDFTYFLSDKSKQKYNELKQTIDNADSAKQQTIEYYAKEKFSYTGSEGDVELFCISVQKVLASYAVDAIHWSNKKVISWDINDYITEAKKKAEAQGYIIDQDGTIYSKEQIAISELLQKYVTLRKRIEENETYMGCADPKQDAIAKNVFEYLQEFKRYIDEDHWYTSYSTEVQYFEKYQDVSEYIYTIYELARLGIAVPEFALTPANANVERGVDRMYSLTDKRKKRAKILEVIEEEFAKWLKALSNTGIAPPKDVFDPYMKALAQVDKELDKLYQEAEKNLAQMTTPRFLVWEPESFKPKAEDTILDDSMPLREFTAAKLSQSTLKKTTGVSTSRIFRQFSLLDLARKTLNKTTAFYKTIESIQESIKKPFKSTGNSQAKLEKSLSLANLGSQADLLQLYLENNQCEEISIDNKYFKNNIFQYKDFFDNLKAEKTGYHIATLEDPAALDKLGQELQAILFQNQLFTRLMKFDHGAGAQLVRLIQSTYKGDNGHPKLEASVQTEMKGPTLISPGISGSIGLTISNGRGTVSLGEIYFPLVNTDPVKYGLQPYEFKIGYKNIWDETKVLDLGKIYLKISATASGFSGASFMLSGEASLYSDKTGLSLTTIDRVTGQASKAGVSGSSVNGAANFFTGASASVTGKAEIGWLPPKSVVTAFSEFYANTDPSNINSYKTLAEIKLTLSAFAGIGIEANFAVSLINKRLHITAGAGFSLAIGCKGAIGFEIDRECIWQFVHLINQAIIDNDNNPLNFVTNEASGCITRYTLIGMSGLLYAVTMSAEAVERLYEEVINLGKDGSTSVIAMRLVDNQTDPDMIKWLAELSPKSFGVLMYSLINQYKGASKYQLYSTVRTTLGGKDGYYKMDDKAKYHYVDEHTARCDHQEAILICLQAIDARNDSTSYNEKDPNTGEIIPNAAQSLFEEVILRLNSKGDFPFPLSEVQAQQLNTHSNQTNPTYSLDAARLNSYCTNLAWLEQFMAKRPPTWIDQSIKDRYEGIQLVYGKLIKKLANRIISACQPGLTEVEQFLKGKALRLEKLRGKTAYPYPVLGTTRKTS